MHLAYSRNGTDYLPLNKNYGILFEKGDISPENLILPRGVKEPRLFRMPDGAYGVCGIRILEAGTPDAEYQGMLVWWTTRDFIRFERVGCH